jgi:hypothetical protein
MPPLGALPTAPSILDTGPISLAYLKRRGASTPEVAENEMTDITVLR